MVYLSQPPPFSICEISSTFAGYTPLYTIECTAVGCVVSSARETQADVHCDGHVPVAKHDVRSAASSTWSGLGTSPSE